MTTKAKTTARCLDCDAPIPAGQRFCAASDEAGCVARTAHRYGGDVLGLAGQRKCELCGQPCPFHCLCPECGQAMCDDCYTSHFEANCTPALAAPGDDLGELRAHLVDAGLLAEAICGVDHLHSHESGDNGGCHNPAQDTCERCGLPICHQHAWWTELNEQGITICSVCYGVYGVERRERSGGAGRPKRGKRGARRGGAYHV